MNDWQSVLAKSAALQSKAGKERKRAGVLLWDGAKAAIGEWIDDSGDAQAEDLYASVLDAMGPARKGDASKIKAVALAVSTAGLVLDSFGNLAKAYAEATRLTKTAKTHEAEDEAAEAAVEDIASNGPKSSSKPEGAAYIVLSQGVDEAVRVLCDAIGKDNALAQRALLRALTQEIAGRVKPAPKPKVKTSSKSKATKAPVKRRKASKAPVEPEEDIAEDIEPEDGGMSEDMFDMLEETVEDETVEDETVEDETVEAPKARKAPVRRKGRPVRR